MRMAEYEVPDPAPDEVLVQVTLACICGSDLHMWRGEVPWFQRAPGIQGHEMAGQIVQLGANRKTDSLGRPLSDGDRVASFVRLARARLADVRAAGEVLADRRLERARPVAVEDVDFRGPFAQAAV